MMKSVKALTASSFVSMFFLGLATAVIGAAARNIGLTPYQIGLLLAIQNLGFIVSVSIAGALSDTREKPRILFVGSLTLCVGLLVFFFSNAFPLFLVAMFLVGAGIGTYEGVTDAMLMDLHKEKESLHISINHFFVTLGSIAITVYLIFLQMNWRNAIIQSAVVVFLLAVLFGLARLKPSGRVTDSYLERLKILRKEPIIVALFLCTVLVVGVETTFIGVVTTYLMDLREFTQVTSKMGLLAFLSGVVTGRLLMGLFVRKEKMPYFIMGLMASSFVFFSSVFVFNLGELTYVPIFLAGISISALLPLLLTSGGLMYKEISGTVLGLIKIAIPLGGILVPFVMSVVARYSSFETSLFVFPVCFVISFILILGVRRKLVFPPASVLNEAGIP